MPRTPVVRISSVSLRYGGRLVLDDLTVDLTTGITGLVGVNGAGKTTLMNVLATIRRPASGSFSVTTTDGTSVSSVAGVRRVVALAPQTLAPPRSLRVDQFLQYMAWMRGIRRRDRAPDVARVLELVDLAGRTRDRMGELSGGMVQRVNLAQALLGRPRVLLLDEPMDGLDPEQRVRMRAIIASLGDTAAVLISSHVMDDLVPIADRVLMLDGGRFAFDGSPDDLAEVGSGAVVPGGGISPHEAAFLALRGAGR